MGESTNDRPHVDQVGLTRHGVRHQSGMRVVEDAGLDELYLSAAALLSGGADDFDRDAEVVSDGREADRSAEAGGADQVVTAGMSDAGQGVVLGTEGKNKRTAASGGLERCLEIADAAADRKVPRRKEFGCPAGGLVLREAQLGMRVDLPTESDQLLGDLRDRSPRLHLLRANRR
jgi:hypothetical protein